MQWGGVDGFFTSVVRYPSNDQTYSYCLLQLPLWTPDPTLSPTPPPLPTPSPTLEPYPIFLEWDLFIRINIQPHRCSEAVLVPSSCN